MARPKSDNVQINISIPSEWKTKLENLARIYSVEEGKNITFLDLMRRGIQEKYQLKEINPYTDIIGEPTEPTIQNMPITHHAKKVKYKND